MATHPAMAWGSGSGDRSDSSMSSTSGRNPARERESLSRGGGRVTDAALSVRVTVDDATQVGWARRAAVAVASDLGMHADTAGNIGLVATELATNLVRHARDGVLF